MQHSNNERNTRPSLREEVRAFLQSSADFDLPLDRRGILSYTDLMSLPVEEDDHLLEPFLSRTGLSTIAGPPDTGKSLICRQLALSVGLGLDNGFGFPLKTRHQHAIYWNSEDYPAQIKKVNRIQGEALANGRIPNLTTLFSYRFPARVLAETLQMILESKPADLIVLDGYGDMLDDRDGNTNSDVRKVLEPFSDISAVYKTHIILITHVNKSNYFDPPHQKNLQGGGAYGQKIRCSLEMRNNRATDLRSLTCTKGNELSDEMKKKAYKLDFDPKTFLFTATKETVALSDTVSLMPQASKPAEIDFREVFGDRKYMYRAELVDRIMDIYDRSEATADRALRELKKSRRGKYINPFLDRGDAADDEVDPE